MSGYIRQRDTEIADGNIIEAEFFKAEYDQLQAAFNSATGHAHNGSAGEGPPIIVVGPTQDVSVATNKLTPRVNNFVDVGSASLRFKNVYAQGLTSVAGDVTAVSFTGIGTALTALNGTEITSGTIPDARLPTTIGRTSRVITAGAGLTGGGDLSADRTLDIGAGSGISVTDDAVAVDSTVVRTTRNIVSGDGLVGGGTLDSDRTLSVGAGDGVSVSGDAVAVDSSVVRTGRLVASGDGLQGGGDLSADRSLSVDATVVRTTGTQTVGGAKTFSTRVASVGYSGTGTNPYLASDGTVAAPSYSWTSDPDTGVYSAGVNTIGFSAGGAHVATISAAGFTGVGTALTALNGSNISTGTVADARIASTITRNSRAISAGDGLTGGGDLSADRSFAVDATVVRTSGNQTIAGAKTFSSSVVGAKFEGPSTDSAVAPSFTWTGDTNTGMFRKGADEIGFATGGAERGSINNTGFVGNGSQLTNLPVAALTGTLPINQGGTGATTIATARAALEAAPLASPAFTGVPTSPTPSIGDNSTKIATTNYVHDEVPEILNAGGSAPMFACRAWVNFNGTGTPTIRAAGNVSSITDNGAGDYTINFTVAMPDTDYAVITTGSNDAGDTTYRNTTNQNHSTLTVSSCRIFSHGVNSSAQAKEDAGNISVAIFR